jgi:hypothetical protein
MLCVQCVGTHFQGQHQQPVASALTQVLGHIQVPILAGYEEARGAILRTPRMYVTCDVNYTKPLLDIIVHTHACMSQSPTHMRPHSLTSTLLVSPTFHATAASCKTPLFFASDSQTSGPNIQHSTVQQLYTYSVYITTGRFTGSSLFQYMAVPEYATKI